MAVSRIAIKANSARIPDGSLLRAINPTAHPASHQISTILGRRGRHQRAAM
jgi:hypothetical protein